MSCMHPLHPLISWSGYGLVRKQQHTLPTVMVLFLIHSDYKLSLHVYSFALRGMVFHKIMKYAGLYHKECSFPLIRYQTVL